LNKILTHKHRFGILDFEKANSYLSLEDSGLTFSPQLVQEGKRSTLGGYRAALKLLKEQSPDAIFCYNDLMAIGAILAAEHLELKVPDDIAVVGFDDIMMASMITPPLTTMGIPQFELGKLTGTLIMELLKDQKTDSQIILYPVKLQVRGYSGAGEFSREKKRQLHENLISSFSVDLPNGP
jgi:LacI family transcriptional regulator